MLSSVRYPNWILSWSPYTGPSGFCYWLLFCCFCCLCLHRLRLRWICLTCCCFLLLSLLFLLICPRILHALPLFLILLFLCVWLCLPLLIYPPYVFAFVFSSLVSIFAFVLPLHFSELLYLSALYSVSYPLSVLVFTFSSNFDYLLLCICIRF